MAQRASSSIGEAVSLTRRTRRGGGGADGGGEGGLYPGAQRLVLATAGSCFLLLAAGIWRSLATVTKPRDGAMA